MEVYTTGFTKKTAAQFFGSLKQAGIKRLVDVRLKSFDENEYGVTFVTNIRLSQKRPLDPLS
jgi:hypothetical protein